MLTKDDLKQIRTIVREEVGNEAQSIKDDLGADITMLRMRLQGEIKELQDRTKNVEIRITKMHKELKEEIKTVAHFLDKDNIETRKDLKTVKERVEKLEEN